MTNETTPPEETAATQDYIDAIKEAKASGRAVSINFGDLPKGVVAAAIQTELHNGLPREYVDAIGGAASSHKTISLDFGQVKPTEEPSNPMMDVAKQAGNAALGLFGAAPRQELFAPPAQPLQPTSGNPVMGGLQAAGQTLQNPLRVAPTLSQPGQIAGQKVEDAIGPSHPMLGKAAGLVTSTALDPLSYTTGPIGDTAGKALDSGAQWAGKEAATGLSSVSGVKVADIFKLFKNPGEIVTAGSSKDAGAAYGALKKVLGVGETEEKLIAKAGDRAPGVSRTVAEDLIQKAKSAELEKMGVQAEKGGYTAAQLDSVPLEQAANNLTLGEHIAARRAALKMAQDGKGSESALYAQNASALSKALEARQPEVLNAISTTAKAKTKEEFMRFFPRQKSNRGAADFFKAIGTLFSAGLTSPAATGAATLAAKGVYGVGKAALGNAVVKRGVPAVTVSTIRNFLQKRP
jgi:hypothetical protein